MFASVRLRPPNSVLLIIGDVSAGELPRSMDEGLIASTPTCIAVATLCEIDGETSVVLTDEDIPAGLSQTMRRAFTGKLATPATEVHVRTVTLESIAKLTVPSQRIDIDVWVNDDREPDEIRVFARPTSRRRSSSR